MSVTPAERRVWFPPMRSFGWPSIIDDMQLFVVERHLIGWTAEEVDFLVQRTARTAAHFATAGVRHFGSLVLPTDEICLDLFEGPDADAVAAINRAAGLRVDRVLVARTAAFAPKVA